jgi:protein involved in ribonucleotide reduction
MRRSLLVTVLLMALVDHVVAQQPQFSWAMSFGNSNTDAGKAVWVDADKNIYTTGTFVGQVDFDPGIDQVFLNSPSNTRHVFVQKLNVNGQLEWIKGFGGANAGISIDIFDITVDGSGNVIVSGEFLGTADFNPGPQDSLITSVGNTGGISPNNMKNPFVVKLDVDGNFVWACGLGATSAAQAGGGDATTVITDNNNDIYIGGWIYGTLDFNPGAGQNTYSAASSLGSGFLVKLSANGIYSWASIIGSGINDTRVRQDHIYVTGASFQGINSINHLIVRKMEIADGSLVWEKTVFGNSFAVGRSLYLDDKGNVISTGSFDGVSTDFNPGAGPDSVLLLNSANGTAFIQKLDSSGVFKWAKNFNATTSSIVAGYNGNIYTTGSFSGTADLNPGPGPDSVFNLMSTSGNDAFIQKLDSSGSFVWAGQFGVNGNETGHSITVDDLKNIYVSGQYTGTQDFDPGTGVNSVANQSSVSNSPDIFLVKLNDAIVVPVKMISFTALAVNFESRLKWQTENEINAGSFAIERSQDGVYFKPVGSVAAKNTSGKNDYYFIDHSPLKGINFYRLKQIDRDGQFEYSGIVKLVFAQNQALVYPNPASGFISIVHAGDLTRIKLLDLTGRLIREWKPAPGNLYPLTAVSQGNYILKLEYADKTETIQLNVRSN